MFSAGDVTPSVESSHTRQRACMQMDDDYVGFYDDFDGGYGGDYGDGMYGEDYGDLAPATAAAAESSAAAAASSTQGVDHAGAVPVPGLKEEPEANVGKAAAVGENAAGGNSRVVVDVSDEEGGRDAGAGDGVASDDSEVVEGEQEGLMPPQEEEKQKVMPFKVHFGVQ